VSEGKRRVGNRRSVEYSPLSHCVLCTLLLLQTGFFSGLPSYSGKAGVFSFPFTCLFLFFLLFSFLFLLFTEWSSRAYLEVQVVDGRKGPEAVVAHPECGVVHLGRKAQRQQQRPRVHPAAGSTPGCAG